MKKWDISQYNINENDVHIWNVKIPYDVFKEFDCKVEGLSFNNTILNYSALNKEFKDFINTEEFNYSMKFYKFKDKIRSLTSKYILKKLISGYLKINQNFIKFYYNDFSKPFICSDINPICLQFNLSHSGDFISISFTCNSVIGVDIELYDYQLDKECLLEQIFSEQEILKWKILSENEKLKSFYHVWSCKEAILKGIGTGLSYSPKNITVNINPNENPFIINLKNCIYEHDLNAWNIFKFNVSNNYSGICAVRKHEINISYYVWDWDFNCDNLLN